MIWTPTILASTLTALLVTAAPPHTLGKRNADCFADNVDGCYYDTVGRKGAAASVSLFHSACVVAFADLFYHVGITGSWNMLGHCNRYSEGWRKRRGWNDRQCPLRWCSQCFPLWNRRGESPFRTNLCEASSSYHEILCRVVSCLCATITMTVPTGTRRSISERPCLQLEMRR